uniref:Beta-lactamase-related domain-containing protein n=1 Tax=Chromera velia CCMP2878 TaxID=1169474 RepID=A0A0G4HK17_9ALVE|eukprot:Cvel_7163.t1-p1 / transcript=Cvel_7163.t1 / gene=Cvel_7163 / organism=Chromera_velia_CCMP2878 / gene_product=Protein flp, putative / transcript_product=Protein flp, putative / location=Cvel_scaffold368:78952-81229(+) / protein_length=607 / sequence_SO=supercontig / SO=protein_coding / is_pseudo=false
MRTLGAVSFLISAVSGRTPPSSSTPPSFRPPLDEIRELQDVLTSLNEGARERPGFLFDAHEGHLLGAHEQSSTLTGDSPKEKLRAVGEDALRCGKAPGLFLTVVKGDETVIAEGFGLRDVAKNLPVTENTLFGIGSTSKAFTATLLGMRKDAGEVDFDTPVSDLLDGFRLKDDAASLSVTPRDLMTHHTGMPRHDYAWVLGRSDNMTRHEMMLKFRNFESATPVRTKFLYNNFMWTTVGLIVEKLAGHSWEEEVTSRIFTPLGMNSTTASFKEAKKRGAEVAVPAVWVESEKENGEGKFVPLSWEANLACDFVGPAGSINTNARDIAKWMRFNLDPSGKGLISPQTFAEIHSPLRAVAQIATGLAPPTFPVRLDVPNYGLGWIVGLYRDLRVVFHGGGTLGVSTMVLLIPEKKFGVALSGSTTNFLMPQHALLGALRAVDIALGLGDWLDSDHICEFPKPFVKSKSTQIPVSDRSSAERTLEGAGRGAKSLRGGLSEGAEEADAYSGIYEEPAYGPLRVSSSEGTNGEGKRTLKFELGLSGPIPCAQNANDLFDCPAFFVLDDVPASLFFERDTEGPAERHGKVTAVILNINNPGDFNYHIKFAKTQ